MMSLSVCKAVILANVAAIVLWVKTELAKGAGLLFVGRACLFNEITGNDGSYGIGIAELTAEGVTEGVSFSGKVGIVTGANTGIGLESSRVMAMRGMRVIMACRSMARCNEARA